MFLQFPLFCPAPFLPTKKGPPEAEILENLLYLEDAKRGLMYPFVAIYVRSTVQRFLLQQFNSADMHVEQMVRRAMVQRLKQFRGSDEEPVGH